ncbi:MAG TPA: amidohydrolase family protein [Acidimicrobiales bacterium]|nr:amidohydrolase family protein [Acidimicrobiales bacterium]
MIDLLIRGATVVDGTGSPPKVADIGVSGGRIVSIGRYDGEKAYQVIDASGLVVSPGFVDLHTHYDAQLFWDPYATPSCFHGVTTVLGGNCGFSIAPAGADHAAYLSRMMARVEGMPLAALEAGLDWGWESFSDWLDRLDGRIGVNAGFLVGHSALRRAVMGSSATGGRATPEQIERMVGMLRDGLAAGGLGFSSSQAHTHSDGDGNPVPSRHADTDELMALAAEVKDHPGTTLELIVPGCLGRLSEEEADLMAAMSLAGDRPLNWNVLGVTAADPTAHEHQLAVSTRAAQRGATVVALTLPHQMQIRLSFLSGFVLDGLPGWRDTFALPVAERIAALRDPAVRGRLAAGARSEEAGILRGLARWDRMVLAETFAPVNDGLSGLTVSSAAEHRGVGLSGGPDAAFDFLLDIVTADGLRTGLQPPTMSENPDDWKLRAEVWRDPRTVVGGSDAGAHLDMMCGAIYSTSLLGDGVRERGLLSLEEAVHQLTDVPARLYGLRDRGRIAEGWIADLTVFDPESVGHGPPRTRDDLPGGASRLYAEAMGVEHVIVNGVPLVQNGRLTGKVPGTLLRSGRDTETVHAAPV